MVQKRKDIFSMYTPTEQFIIDLIVGNIKRDNLPNHSDKYSGSREIEERERFVSSMSDESSKQMYKILGEPFNPNELSSGQCNNWEPHL